MTTKVVRWLSSKQQQWQPLLVVVVELYRVVGEIRRDADGRREEEEK